MPSTENIKTLPSRHVTLPHSGPQSTVPLFGPTRTLELARKNHIFLMESLSPRKLGQLDANVWEN